MKNYKALLVSILFLALAKVSCSQSSSYDLAVKNVKVFDSKHKTVAPNKTVLIQADTIAAIVDAKTKFKAINTLEGKGRLLVPGFIDTHTHLMQNYGNNETYSPEYIEEEDFDLVRGLMAHQYLRQGVTTIIDMGQPETWMEVTLNWQKNPLPGYPNLYICGGSIVSDENRWQPQHHIEVMSPEDGRKKVQKYAKMGLKHMKLYRKLRKPDMEAMVDEAKKQGITINTHVDNNVVTIPEAMDYGISNFEHFFTVTPSVLSYDEHWKRMNEAYGIKMSSSIDEFAAHMVFFFAYIKEHPEFEAKLETLFDRMAKEGASISTAINVLASAAGKTDFFSSFEYFPIRRSPMVSYTEAQQEKLEEAFFSMMQYVKLAHDKGVKLRIGTDCRFGGKSLLAELMIFYEAGIPIADILQIATINGYEAMKLDHLYGSIEVGKKADMVLFDKNPFDDYKNFLAKKTIIKGGEVFSLKKSIAYELLEVLVDEGPEAGLSWFDKSKSDKSYDELNAKEAKNVVSELIGTGKVEEAQAVFSLYEKAFPGRTMDIEGTDLTNGTYALLRKGELEKARAFYAFGEAKFPDAERTLPLAVLLTLLQEGIPAGQQKFAELKDHEKYTFNEGEMNGVGYLLLQSGKQKEAIAIFELNVSAFPESWNAYDSLGEAHAAAGNTKLAIQHYEKSIALNPENTNGIAVLKKLRGEK